MLMHYVVTMDKYRHNDKEVCVQFWVDGVNLGQGEFPKKCWTTNFCPVLSSRHLHSEHSHGDRSIAQWKIQQDIVQCMESQVGI